MARFIQIHQYDEYRDFEPDTVLAIGGYSRISFNDEKHTAYATLVDPEATLENDVFPHSDKCIDLTWDEALALVQVSE